MQTVRTEDGAAEAVEQAAAGRDGQRWGRLEAASKLAAYEQLLPEGASERERADTVGVPRATLRSWQSGRAEETDEVARFFETPAGIALLHRVVLAAIVTIRLMGAGGIRMVQMFLRLSGLSRYVASSYGALQSYGKQVEQGLMAYEDQERPRLGAQMRAKLLTVCLDETFHPAICLVGMEPVSGFILVERYSARRDAASWDAALSDGLKGLNADVVQATSDEAKAIVHHVRTGLDANHSPDVFHVQHGLSKGTAAPLSAQVRAAEQAVQAASEQAAAMETEQRQAAQQPRVRGRPPDHGARVQKAREEQYAAGEQEGRNPIGPSHLRLALPAGFWAYPWS